MCPEAESDKATITMCYPAITMKPFAFTIEIEGVDLTDKVYLKSLREAGFTSAKIVCRRGVQRLHDKAEGPSRERVEDNALQRVCGALPGVTVRVSAHR